MATVRKLQAEIDKTFRKVDEQQEVFQQVFDRLHECDQSLKEKYEVRLLAYATTMRFFSPALNWNLAHNNCFVIMRALSLSLSLSLSADFIATFFFVPRRRGLVVAFFFGCILSFCAVVACSRTCFAGKHKRAFECITISETTWKERDLSLRELSLCRRVSSKCTVADDERNV